MNHAFEQALAGLNPRQREAVGLTTGPILVIAGAGSGKTRMLTVRIAWLVEREGVLPSNILAVTFTNKAAREMRERVLQLIPGSGSDVTLSTFHSFCCGLLRRWSAHAGFPDGFTIFDEDDSEKLMKSAITELHLDLKDFAPKKMLSLISQAKNDLVEPADFKPVHLHSDTLIEIYRKYQAKLTENRALDFDDLLMLCWKLLSTHPDLLEKFHKRYTYFLVDEYQDTNHAQYRLLKLFAQNTGNLCVVGDEDQSIYSWRGATIRNIQEFEKDFPGTRLVCLDQNYRSTQRILDAAGALISHNVRTHVKNLWTDTQGGEPLSFNHASDDREEADWVVGQIRAMADRGAGLRNFAVLFRMNSLSRSIEQSLTRFGIPYEVTGGTKFFHRREVKDVLGYLRVIANPHDSVSLARIINTPRRGIGKTLLAKMEAEGPLWESIVEHAKAGTKGKIAQFHDMIAEWRDRSPDESLFALVKSILDKTEYLNYLSDTDPDTAEERRGNIDSLVSDIRYQEEADPELGLRGYLEKVSLQSDVDDLDENTDRVHLLTLHNAKGLEFPVVFMIAMEEGIFPHYSAHAEPSELEEERRLAYVGMTRARERLLLSAARRRMVFGTWKPGIISRFLTEIPRSVFEGTPSTHSAPSNPSIRSENYSTLEAVPVRQTLFEGSTWVQGSRSSRSDRDSVPASMGNIHPGTEVFHPVFLHGKVLATEGESLGDFRLTIFFKKVGKKTLLLQYANLKVIQTKSSGG